MLSVGNVLLPISKNEKIAESALIWWYQTALMTVPPTGPTPFRTTFVSFVPTYYSTTELYFVFELIPAKTQF